VVLVVKKIIFIIVVWIIKSDTRAIKMPHIFSVEIHEYLSGKMEQAERTRKLAILDNDMNLQRRLEGELLELVKMRQYLTENIDLKTQKYY
jgi:hypothetical protein